MTDLSKLGVSDDVRPYWSRGVPYCSEEDRPGWSGCPSFDGKSCRALGFRPGRICEPAVEAMARAIPGFLEKK